LAGAYPCLAPLNAKQSVIKTIAKAAKTVYDKAVKTAKQQVGKLINLMLEVEGGDCGAVIAQLIRKDGFPKRIEPWSYHIRHTPEMLQGGYS
jgi:DNA relaxase NicK